MAIHENGDETLRPTNAAWKCPHCGTELYTASCILSHKERCKENKQDKKEEERNRKIQESLKQFKIKHGIEIRKRRMNEQGAVRS
jgi:beta-lactamase regulating signal transducer with metallopeptidase domain